ncbi:tetratricopeptide repeat protein [Streptomyces sp. JL4002]|uniref:tetratricopeptide repeat protein n=1 Tax=Streptomyces sp. JL4002 TaxID=3404781 RepID=UPI003B284442
MAALVTLAELREGTGDLVGAERLYRQVADRGSPVALYRLAGLRKGGGDLGGAETLYWQAVDHGSTDVLYRLAALREGSGDRDGAETLYRQAADHGSPDALYHRVNTDDLNRLWPYGLDPDGAPTSPWQQSVGVEPSRHVPPRTP